MDHCRRLLASLRSGDVSLVPRRIGQRPPGGRKLIAHHPATCGKRRLDTSLRLLIRHPDRDMDRTTAIAAGLVHLLEPERWPAIVRVDEILDRAVWSGLVPEHRP